MKIVTGHQPVYLPWLGLLHKASLADVFVFMDDVQYLEQDWNNRNKVKTPQGVGKWLTVPVNLKGSASRALKDIRIAPTNGPLERGWQALHWSTLKSFYTRAPHFAAYRPFFEDLYLGRQWEKLSDLNLAILRQAFEWFAIDCEIVVASTRNFSGQKSDLVLDHALKLGGDVVVTGALGRDYIRVDDFAAKSVKVVFQEYRHPVYEQRFGAFVPCLSFVDLLFNHGPESRRICLQENLTRAELCQLTSR